MARVVHFEINAKDTERAIKFYESIFNWKFEKWAGPFDYWMIMTGDGPGIDGGMNKQEDMPGFTTSVTIDVKGIDDVISKIKTRGGEITQEKMAVPGVGWMAQFKDAEGNTLGLMETDETAH